MDDNLNFKISEVLGNHKRKHHSQISNPYAKQPIFSIPGIRGFYSMDNLPNTDLKGLPIQHFDVMMDGRYVGRMDKRTIQLKFGHNL